MKKAKDKLMRFFLTSILSVKIFIVYIFRSTSGQWVYAHPQQRYDGLQSVWASVRTILCSPRQCASQRSSRHVVRYGGRFGKHALYSGQLCRLIRQTRPLFRLALNDDSANTPFFSGQLCRLIRQTRHLFRLALHDDSANTPFIQVSSE